MKGWLVFKKRELIHFYRPDASVTAPWSVHIRDGVRPTVMFGVIKPSAHSANCADMAR